MHQRLYSNNKQPEHQAAHDIRLEGPLIQLAEPLLERGSSEPQRPAVHVAHAHATVGLHFDRVVYYVVVL